MGGVWGMMTWGKTWREGTKAKQEAQQLRLRNLEKRVRRLDGRMVSFNNSQGVTASQVLALRKRAHLLEEAGKEYEITQEMLSADVVELQKRVQRRERKGSKQVIIDAVTATEIKERLKVLEEWRLSHEDGEYGKLEQHLFVAGVVPGEMQCARFTKGETCGKVKSDAVHRIEWHIEMARKIQEEAKRLVPLRPNWDTEMVHDHPFEEAPDVMPGQILRCIWEWDDGTQCNVTRSRHVQTMITDHNFNQGRHDYDGSRGCVLVLYDAQKEGDEPELCGEARSRHEG